MTIRQIASEHVGSAKLSSQSGGDGTTQPASGALVSGITWSNTTCPDGTRSDTNGTSPQSCKGHGGGL